MKAAFFLSAFTAIVSADELQPLGDEFNDSGTLRNWEDLGITEGWGTPSVQQRDIDVSTPGHFHIVPGALTWFGHLRGALFYKEITGDFIATGKFRILSRHNPLDPTEVPNSSFSLSGILAHGPRPIVQAAPAPYTTAAVWPPINFGSDYLPNTENYIFLAYGTAGNAGTRQFEIKATRDSSSRLYFDSTGIDQSATDVWLQMVRVGDTVICLRKHSETGDWIVENRYPNDDHPFPNFGPSLQVGITAYTDWPTARPFNNAGLQASYHFNYAPPAPANADLISQVDYYRYQRPNPAVTEAVLQAIPVSYNPANNSTANPPVILSGPAAAHLGDFANVPVSGLIANDIVATESSPAIVTVTRSGSEGEVTVQYSTTPGTATDDFTPTSGTLTWAAGESGPRVINIPIIDDATAEGLEQFTVTLDQISGPANFPGGELSRTVTVSITETIYDQWRLDVFGAIAANPSTSAAADFDNDSLQNLLEYILGSDPTVSDVSPAPRFVQTAGDPEFRFTPSLAAFNATLTIESSPDLSVDSWSAVAILNAGSTLWEPQTELVSVTVNEDTSEVILTDSFPQSSPHFLRLRVTLE